MQGVRGAHATPGEFRRSQNWIGSPGCTLTSAKYVPPTPDELQDCLSALEKFLHDIKHLEKNRFETRSFAYLDIISWVESKVYNKTMSTVIHDKYLESKRKK